MELKQLFGLVGRDIEYSFSRNYFQNKFEALQLIDCKYVNFDLESIDVFRETISANRPILKGLNVTIPYKEAVIPFLDQLDSEAQQIGAVNTISIKPSGKLVGYNTDVYGFEQALRPMLNQTVKRALILGTGGASKAVAFVLHKLNIEFYFVSRSSKNAQTLAYSDIDKSLIENHALIVNCTPLGTHPNIEECPDLPYEFLNNNHILFDLIYNPTLTTFLSKGKAVGAQYSNGYKMLEFQAEKSWDIWNM